MASKLQVLAGTIIFATMAIAPAAAADMPLKSPAAIVANNWGGFYAGINGGGEWGRLNANTSTIFAPVGGYFAVPSVAAVNAAGVQNINANGAVAGGQLGYNWQAGNAVVGLETDFQYYGLRGSARASGVYPPAPTFGFAIDTTVKNDWLFTARPRFGLALGNWLPYVTGGVAVGHATANFVFSDTFAAAAESASISKTKTGWTAGAGVEWVARSPWTFKLEYLHVDLGNISATSDNLTLFVVPVPNPANVFTHAVNLRSDMVRAGVNYRFGAY